MAKTMNVWQPYAQMGVMSEDETVIVRGEGSYIYTDSGEKLFDSSAALWYANLGHGNRELAEAAYRQMLELETYYIWAGMLHPRVIELADVLTADGIAPIPNAKVMFGAGGSDSADIAFKLARLHWQLRGKSEKRTILHRTHAYHGLHAFGTSVNGESEVREMFGPTTLVPETGIIDFENIDLVREQVLALGPETIAAIVAEPVIGAGGVYPPAPGYLPGLRQLCDEFGILLIFDEVITGFGRVGEWFAAHRYQVTPDLLMFAKGITSGYQPLGGVYAGPQIWEPFWDEKTGHKFAFGTTYSGHATGCAVALRTIEILARDGHLERVKELERRLGNGLRDHVAHLPTIESVRHEGLMASVNFNPSLDVEVLRGRMRKRGIHTRAAAAGIAISPPFITTDAEMDELIHVLAEEAAYV